VCVWLVRADERAEQLRKTSALLHSLLEHQDSILSALQRPAVEDAVPVEPEYQK
jgi:hypothetical protein